MRVWEKIWWGFVLSFLGISLVGIWFKKGEKIKYRYTFTTKVVGDRYISKGKSCLYATLIILGIGLILWLVFKGITWLTGK